MWLSVLKTFLEGRDKFHAGEVRCIDDEDAAMRFIGRGWAKRIEAPEVAAVAPKGGEAVSLEVHKSTLGMKERKHG